MQLAEYLKCDLVVGKRQNDQAWIYGISMMNLLEVDIRDGTFRMNKDYLNFPMERHLLYE
ncbi:hypothetical protein CN946_20100 [Bacillus sp. AFS053548]|nr:hypothetical protein CN946_20100 [Bacillus sp. AFS053548]